MRERERGGGRMQTAHSKSPSDWELCSSCMFRYKWYTHRTDRWVCVTHTHSLQNEENNKTILLDRFDGGDSFRARIAIVVVVVFVVRNLLCTSLTISRKPVGWRRLGETKRKVILLIYHNNIYIQIYCSKKKKIIKIIQRARETYIRVFHVISTSQVHNNNMSEKEWKRRACKMSGWGRAIYYILSFDWASQLDILWYRKRGKNYLIYSW